MPKLSPAAKLLKAKRALAKKVAAKKVAAKKVAAKKVAAKKVAAKKVVAKKPAKKVVAKKPRAKRAAVPAAPALPVMHGPANRPPMSLQEQLKAAIAARKGKINGRPVFGPAAAPFKYRGPQYDESAHAPAHDSARHDLPLAGGRRKVRKARKVVHKARK